MWGCSKFHEYGLDNVLETDHKPIVALSNKSLNDIPPRIQRLMLRLQKWSNMNADIEKKSLKIVQLV